MAQSHQNNILNSSYYNNYRVKLNIQSDLDGGSELTSYLGFHNNAISPNNNNGISKVTVKALGQQKRANRNINIMQG